MARNHAPTNVKSGCHTYNELAVQLQLKNANAANTIKGRIFEKFTFLILIIFYVKQSVCLDTKKQGADYSSSLLKGLPQP